MEIRVIRRPIFQLLLLAALVAGLLPGDVSAQYATPQQGSGTAIRDEPTAFSPPNRRKPEEAKGFMGFLQAVCWYIPNRIADVFDIPRIYLTLGDGQGISLRATKFLEASYFQDDAYILGWSPRHMPFSGEQIEERYLGFLAAQQGKKDRDVSEVGLSLHFIAIGGNIAVSLFEALDFVTGVVGVDLSDDDHGPYFYDNTEPDDIYTSTETRTEQVITTATTVRPLQPAP